MEMYKIAIKKNNRLTWVYLNFFNFVWLFLTATNLSTIYDHSGVIRNWLWGKYSFFGTNLFFLLLPKKIPLKKLITLIKIFAVQKKKLLGYLFPRPFLNYNPPIVITRFYY